MSNRYTNNSYPRWRIENTILLLYIILLIYLVVTKNYNWTIWILITIIFLILLIGLKISNNITWIISNALEDIFYKLLYKIGLGKYAFRMINNLDIAKDDADYKRYKQYITRKRIFNRVLNRKWLNLSLDIGTDALYIVRHYIHQKKEKLANDDNAIVTKQLSSLSPFGFETLIYRLFHSMNYTVQKTGKVTDHTIDLIIHLQDQKILLRTILGQTSIENNDIQETISAQEENSCNAIFLITLQTITKDALDKANNNAIGVVSKERLIVLLNQYLKENWS